MTIRVLILTSQRQLRAYVLPESAGLFDAINKGLWFGRALSASEIADVAQGVKFVFVYERIEYPDIFRRKRWATFGLQYSGVFPPPVGVMFLFSEKGNDSN